MATKREMIWLGDLAIDETAAALTMSDIVPATETTEYGKMTVTRIVGTINLYNSVASNNQVVVGIIAVDTNTTSATVPSPRVQGDLAAPWLYRKTAYLNDDASTVPSAMSYKTLDIDIKAMRKLTRTQKLVLVVDDNANGYVLAADLRVLVKLA